ncbi:hypothetical protein [Yinghuangia seranimata]|uniref:hypothetical protein n=1 Tax=Yinghuangia seranimata TaxID=408067 RepID=UPI00248D38FF|nr:hypothetical protein [Yinghuangia seranimata]MDI2132010.1 hypothetical protein [Yinghuangia seranimata]
MGAGEAGKPRAVKGPYLGRWRNAVVLPHEEGRAATVRYYPRGQMLVTWPDGHEEGSKPLFAKPITTHGIAAGRYMCQFTVDLPAAGDAQRFPTEVDVHWEVTHPDQAVRTAVEDLEAPLRSELLQLLRTITRRFPVTESAAADQAIADAVALAQRTQPIGATYGIRTDVFVRISLDAASVKLATTLKGIQGQVEVSKLKGELQGVEQDSRIGLQVKRVRQIAALIAEGQHAQIAMMLDDDPEALKGIIAIAADEDRAQRTEAMDILKYLVEHEAIEPHQLGDAGAMLIAGLRGSALRRPAVSAPTPAAITSGTQPDAAREQDRDPWQDPDPRPRARGRRFREGAGDGRRAAARDAWGDEVADSAEAEVIDAETVEPPAPTRARPVPRPERSADPGQAETVPRHVRADEQDARTTRPYEAVGPDAPTLDQYPVRPVPSARDGGPAPDRHRERSADAYDQRYDDRRTDRYEDQYAARQDGRPDPRFADRRVDPPASRRADPYDDRYDDSYDASYEAPRGPQHRDRSPARPDAPPARQADRYDADYDDTYGAYDRQDQPGARGGPAPERRPDPQRGREYDRAYDDRFDDQYDTPRRGPHGDRSSDQHSEYDDRRDARGPARPTRPAPPRPSAPPPSGGGSWAEAFDDWGDDE